MMGMLYVLLVNNLTDVFVVHDHRALLLYVDITISKNNVQFGMLQLSVITAKSVGEGITKMLIGDRHNSKRVAITKLNEDFSTDVMTVETVGTGGVTPNNHEGISGWTADFLSIRV